MDLFEVKPGLKFSVHTLKQMLPDVETALFFGKVYELEAHSLGTLLHKVFNTDLTNALTEGTHSHELQDYLVDTLGVGHWISQGQITLAPNVPHGEILPHMWESLAIEVADSIKTVADKLEGVLDKLPGKQGHMVFKSMAVMNAKRPTVGDYRAAIKRKRTRPNLVILDDSGSMSEATIRTLVDDVVALGYKADATLALVSNTTRVWEPGSYDSNTVLAEGQFGGTHYETLTDLLNQDWGTVVTIADYDSSLSAQEHLGNHCSGHIQQVLDISLVNTPTFLSQCVGQLADEVKPLMIAGTSRVLGSHW